MQRRPHQSGRWLGVAVATLVVLSGTTAMAAGASPAAGAAVDGMLTPHGRHGAPAISPAARSAATAAARPGDCELLDQQAPSEAPHCRPTPPTGVTSCSGQISQTTAPSSIRVLVRVDDTTTRIDTIPFLTYVQNVLPNEWLASWDGDALKAGAVAVKSYAWYWVTHYGGFVGATPTSTSCFDVTDDQDFQVYRAGSAVDRTNTKIAESWPVAARRNGQVVETLYRNYFTSPTEACGTGATGTTMSQYGSQNCNEANTGYKYNVILKRYYGQDLQLSTTAQLRSQHDFTFQHRSTGATFTSGRWFIGDGYPTSFSFGQPGDLPFAATTGDGFATAAVWRPSNRTFYVANALHQLVSTVRFGNAGDIPVASHYAGLDAPTQLAIYRPGTGTWYFAGPGGAISSTKRWGLKNDIPVPGRWTSATTDSISVWRPSDGNWYTPGQPAVSWGLKGDIPVPADYNGDGITDVGVYRPSTHAFYVRGMPRVVWGVTGDIPVTGDFDGDGKADFAVYRPSNGNLYVHNQAAVVNLGKGGTPIGAGPVRD